jgi:hypothetical protein
MNKLQLLCVTVLSLLYFFIVQLPCLAAETMVKEVGQDSAYGGIDGTLVGVTTLTFTRRPDDPLECLAQVATAVTPDGAPEDSFSSSALMEVEKGRVRFGVPIVVPDVKDSSRKTTVVVIAEIIKGRF